MLQKISEVLSGFNLISRDIREKKINKAIFLAKLRKINIADTINKCTSENARATITDICITLLQLQKDLKLPRNISKRLDKLADRITELQQAVPGTTEETIAIYKVIIALCNLDKLLGRKPSNN